MLLPIMAGVGTAGIFLTSQSAVDIVLNAVAIAFVFELDDFFYLQMVNKSIRTAFEESPPMSTSPLAIPGGKRRCSHWAWGVWCCDLFFAFGYYCLFVFVDQTILLDAFNNLPTQYLLISCTRPSSDMKAAM